MVHGSVKLKEKKNSNERNEYMACTIRARQFILKVRWLELLTSALEKQNAIYTLNEQTGLKREAWVENEENLEGKCNDFAAKETQTSVKKSDIAEINDASGKKKEKYSKIWQSTL